MLASSSPHVVPLPMSREDAVDPEEAFAADKGIVIDSYEDSAEGVLGKDAEGKLAMIKITLKPTVKFGGETLPSESETYQLHELAHEKCFIANSVKTEVKIVPN